MSASDQTPPSVAAERRSKQIALVLLGTMGVVGGAAVWEAWQRAGLENNPTVTQPEAPAAPLAADRDYPNNDFTPGVGYYHAPYRSWFPFPSTIMIPRVASSAVGSGKRRRLPPAC